MTNPTARKYIESDKIYDATAQGLDVFKHYFPGEDLTNPKHKFKERKDENTPSAQVSLYKGRWRITDFGNQSEINSLDAVAYVIYREQLMYIDALRFIEQVIIRHEVDSSGFKKPVYAAEYSWREVGPTDKKGETTFVFKTHPSAEDLAAIGRYVTAELLEDFSMKAAESYSLCSYSDKYKRDIVHTFKSTPDYPIFVLDCGKFKKIYKPNEPDKRYRFSYAGQKPTNYIFGLDRLKRADNEFVDEDSGEYNYEGSEHKTPHIRDLIRCSGESDALNVASLGYHVYWLNSESANLERDQFQQLDDMCENHYQLMDLDDTGRKMAMEFAHKHMNLYTIQLPDWLKLKRDWRGNPCKDIKDFINISGDDQDDTAHHFGVLKRRSFQMKFWKKKVEEVKGSKVVNYNIDLENYYYFLESHGFYVTDSKYHRKAGYCYTRIDGKVVELINPEQIKKIVKRFTKNWIRSKNLMDEVAILNKINASNQISENNLQELREIELNFRNHKKGLEWLHFKNGSLRITAELIEKVKHDDVPNYILGKLEINDDIISHLIDKNIRVEKTPAIEIKPTTAYGLLLDKLKAATTTTERENINVELANFPELDRYEVVINDEEFIYVRFLKDLAHIYWRKELEEKQELTNEEKKEQNLLLANLMFVMGYMTSEYKNPGKPWLVFLQDLKISDIGKSSGRSGKSLITMGMGKTRPSFYIGARRKDITEKTEFIYDGYTRHHNFIEIDDLYEFAEFDFFYTQVTGKREVNSKHISKQILDYDESGKMIISSNFELQKTDNSTIARLLNSGVSDYYHEKTKYNDYRETRSPLTKYGKMLFDEFTDEEWIKFYNFMAYCIQLQMRFFKIQPPMANLEKRQLRRLMTHGVSRDEEFFKWANSYFIIPPDPRPEFSPAENGYYNVLIVRENAFANFKNTLTDLQQRKFKAPQFRQSLEAWCEYYEYELNPLKLCTGKNATDERRILKTIDSKTTECFYISTIPLDDAPDELTPEEEEDLPF
jgi:hypothetical protein